MQNVGELAGQQKSVGRHGDRAKFVVDEPLQALPGLQACEPGSFLVATVTQPHGNAKLGLDGPHTFEAFEVVQRGAPAFVVKRDLDVLSFDEAPLPDLRDKRASAQADTY